MCARTLEIVDRAYIIYDGRVLFTGSPAELVADANVRAAVSRRGFLAVSATLNPFALSVSKHRPSLSGGG